MICHYQMFKKKILRQRDLAKEVYSFKNSLFQGFLLVPAPSPPPRRPTSISMTGEFAGGVSKIICFLLASHISYAWAGVFEKYLLPESYSGGVGVGWGGWCVCVCVWGGLFRNNLSPQFIQFHLLLTFKKAFFPDQGSQIIDF